eukprot:757334-Hanusia_phi.AAC.3
MDLRFDAHNGSAGQENNRSSHRHQPRRWQLQPPGGMAGAIAAACSNPLDVIKTRLQTQVTSHERTGETKMEFSGPRQVVQDLMKTEGVRGFLRGVGARVRRERGRSRIKTVLLQMLYQAPGAAVCWVTYEYMKHILESSFFGDFFLDDDDD